MPAHCHTGVELIQEERKRQIEEEGWTAEHDDGYALGILAAAGACYALDVTAEPHPDGRGHYEQSCFDASESCWPWDEEWWKPTPKDHVKQLAKAGALIAAEIDRILAALHQPEQAEEG